MLESMKPCDLLPGMLVTARSGQTGKVKICSVQFDGLDPIMTDDYTDDLYYGDGDDSEETEVDIMRVTLPSGAVLWEREQVELRVFEVALYKANRSAFAKSMDDECERIARGYAFNIGQWYDSMQGKLCTFKPAGAEQGLCDGYTVARSWTRELTDDERRNWRKR